MPCRLLIRHAAISFIRTPTDEPDEFESSLRDGQSAIFAAMALAEHLCDGDDERFPFTFKAHVLAAHVADMARHRGHPSYSNELLLERSLRTSGTRLVKCASYSATVNSAPDCECMNECAQIVCRNRVSCYPEGTIWNALVDSWGTSVWAGAIMATRCDWQSPQFHGASTMQELREGLKVDEWEEPSADDPYCLDGDETTDETALLGHGVRMTTRTLSTAKNGVLAALGFWLYCSSTRNPSGEWPKNTSIGTAPPSIQGYMPVVGRTWVKGAVVVMQTFQCRTGSHSQTRSTM